MKIDRLVSIIMILLEKERVGAKELADMFEVSLRTIYRDIDSINMAGIPICATSGVGGGFKIMQKYKVEKNVFSTSDLSAILMGLSGFSAIMNKDELTNALAKIKSFIPADKARDIELKASQIYIDLSPWICNKNIQANLETIKKALQDSKLLTFDYADSHGNRTERIAEPYQLVLKNSQWYFQGYCLKRNDFRLFKISRISSLKTQDEAFEPRAYQKPQLYFDDMSETIQKEIKIRIHKSVMDKVLDYCPFEQLIPDGDEHYIVALPFIENEFYYNFLLGFGDKCECLEPLSVRAEVKRRIQAMINVYEK